MAPSQRWFDEPDTDARPPAFLPQSTAMPEPSERYCLVGLDDRDIALIAGACAYRANSLNHLANHQTGETGVEAGHLHDRSRTADDADRMRQIADRITRALGLESSGGFDMGC